MLRNLTPRLTRATALLVLCALAPQAFSQVNDAREKWYQIEVAIFTQPENAQLAANQETFRKDITLSYGDHTQLLETLEEANLRIQQSSIDKQNLITGGGAIVDTATNVVADTTGSVSPTTLMTPLTPEVIAEILQHQAFIKLPIALRNLNETVGALERRNRQRILFHEAWRQPLIDPDKAAAIIIAGGKTYDSERELAGTIKLGVSRYIHIHTNLWLSEFASNYGQGNQEWPSAPMPPNKQNGEISDTSINLNAGLEKSAQDLWHQYDVIDTTYQNVVNKPFVVTNLATLIQTRRMRSGEVHYIDHPKIGILVTVTPFERDSANN